ncbi:hypothetical protein [Ligaoa zhengdingensis]|uniref:hypothetical protein n=1 Tax=Ligaoa zhengdingensis TaxID=2763658 RepID=UPI0031BA1C57
MIDILKKIVGGVILSRLESQIQLRKSFSKETTIDQKKEENTGLDHLYRYFRRAGENQLKNVRVNSQVPHRFQSGFRESLGTINDRLSADLTDLAKNAAWDDMTPERLVYLAEPVMQRGLGRVSDEIEWNETKFLSDLTLKKLEKVGYGRYLFLSEMGVDTCDACEMHHGHLYTLPELEQAGMIPPIHPHCKCLLIAMDAKTEFEYNTNQEKWIKLLDQKRPFPPQAIYYLQGTLTGGISFVPAPAEEGPAITQGENDKQIKWYRQLCNWAVHFGNDAKDAWDALWQRAKQRNEDKFNSVSNFLDWLTFGIVSGFFEGYQERYERMRQAPTLYNVANWLLSGVPDQFSRTIQPEEAFSFEHWMDSLETALLLYGGYQTARQAAGSLPVSNRGRPDSYNIKDVLTRQGLSEDDFNALRLKEISTLTDDEKALLKRIRESVPMPDENTLMQKVIPARDIEKYLDGTYTKVGGYVTKAEDVAQLATYEDFYESLRLDYPGSTFLPMSDDCIGVIRYTTKDASKISIPYGQQMGGTVSGEPPFTGNGFTKATNGRMIPEFICDEYVDVAGQMRIIEIKRDGTEILRAVYSNYEEKLIIID